MIHPKAGMKLGRRTSSCCGGPRDASWPAPAQTSAAPAKVWAGAPRRPIRAKGTPTTGARPSSQPHPSLGMNHPSVGMKGPGLPCNHANNPLHFQTTFRKSSCKSFSSRPLPVGTLLAGPRGRFGVKVDCWRVLNVLGPFCSRWLRLVSCARCIVPARGRLQDCVRWAREGSASRIVG